MQYTLELTPDQFALIRRLHFEHLETAEMFADLHKAGDKGRAAKKMLKGARDLDPVIRNARPS